jgi:hypothetical protein
MNSAERAAACDSRRPSKQAKCSWDHLPAGRAGLVRMTKTMNAGGRRLASLCFSCSPSGPCEPRSRPHNYSRRKHVTRERERERGPRGSHGTGSRANSSRWPSYLRPPTIPQVPVLTELPVLLFREERSGSNSTHACVAMPCRLHCSAEARQQFTAVFWPTGRSGNRGRNRDQNRRSRAARSSERQQLGERVLLGKDAVDFHGRGPAVFGCSLQYASRPAPAFQDWLTRSSGPSFRCRHHWKRKRPPIVFSFFWNGRTNNSRPSGAVEPAIRSEIRCALLFWGHELKAGPRRPTYLPT